jgi:choline dehydrogenase
MEPNQWPLNLGSERNWSFRVVITRTSTDAPCLSQGAKVLGEGSRINFMVWSHGHKNDWDFFADEVADTAWNYEAVLDIYHRIEDWHVPHAKPGDLDRKTLCV